MILAQSELVNYMTVSDKEINIAMINESWGRKIIAQKSYNL